MLFFTRSHCASGFHSNSSTYTAPPSPSPSSSPPPMSTTIHYRRAPSSRKNSAFSRRSSPSPSLPGVGHSLPVSPFVTPSSTDSIADSNLHSQAMFVPRREESDAECWEKMLALQREYHCYNSARMEAAVEALENGWKIEEVAMPSRFCLDLLNEELKAQIENSYMR
ncbi:hypothetical protein QTJ16_000681 [Diplocarpon rosae]|uniref:Uncharacterized protein n=1 Tax=Diplocarpon rosae TaxID=946125 RepID=A0AAD9T649_9HELO|nr:hypothetical protein QTJ16_000681 [Diplocarpon rosae]